jgi:hypothetical protein
MKRTQIVFKLFFAAYAILGVYAQNKGFCLHN